MAGAGDLALAMDPRYADGLAQGQARAAMLWPGADWQALGLQAAIFTNDLQLGIEAAHRLDFGGVCVNEVPTFRADQMPYGGIRDSGNTKEGPAWAVREMTEERMVVIQR
jgi:acyl-CoA reductase-like NAD-dependent aldehyde dehydrogenase